jgi:hypothetical protein
MSNPRNRPVTIGLRIYRALARAFPDDFKTEYGSDLAQTAEDSIEQVWRREGVLGLLRMLADIALRIPIEHMAELRRDIRYGLRTLAGSPGFTFVALASLSLGIAVATCAYSEVNGLILRDLPDVRRPGELVALQAPVAYPTYQRYRETPPSHPCRPMSPRFLSAFRLAAARRESGGIWLLTRTSPHWAWLHQLVTSSTRNGIELAA